MSIRLTGTTIILALFSLYATAVSAFEFDEGSMVSNKWGTAYHAAKKAQIANPDAGKVTGPVEGFEGIAAEKTMDNYHESFSKENARAGYSLENTEGIAIGVMR
jgi:hypothetical protein